MSLTEKIGRRKSSESSKLLKSQSFDRRSRTSSGSRKSFSKKTLTEPGNLERPAAECVNYANEIVLIFYDSLLKSVVETWNVVAAETTDTEVKGTEDEIKVKDFKDITCEDLVNAEVVAVKASQVSLTKKRVGSFLQMAQRSLTDGK